LSAESICREHCEAYNPEIAELTSMLDYESCLFECEELYKLLRELAEMVRKRCEEEAKMRPEAVRERFLKGCTGHDLGMIAYHPELVERLLKLIASELGVRL
jgi:predicted nuclease of restriction endonuclease-like RecB superfamily